MYLFLKEVKILILSISKQSFMFILPSVMAQLLKNLPAMQQTWIQSLGWKDPLEKEMATHSCLGNPLDRGARQATVHGVAKESDMT